MTWDTAVSFVCVCIFSQGWNATNVRVKVWVLVWNTVNSLSFHMKIIASTDVNKLESKVLKVMLHIYIHTHTHKCSKKITDFYIFLTVFKRWCFWTITLPTFTVMHAFWSKFWKDWKRLYVLALINTSHMAEHFTSDRTHKPIYSPVQKCGDDKIFLCFWKRSLANQGYIYLIKTT